MLYHADNLLSNPCDITPHCFPMWMTHWLIRMTLQISLSHTEDWLCLLSYTVDCEYHPYNLIPNASSYGRHTMGFVRMTKFRYHPTWTGSLTVCMRKQVSKSKYLVALLHCRSFQYVGRFAAYQYIKISPLHIINMIMLDHVYMI